MEKKSAQRLVGTVISAKMDKTITVAVLRTTRHPVYKRVLKKAGKYKVHDKDNSARVGNKVIITQTRPLSKTKRWSLVKVLK